MTVEVGAALAAGARRTLDPIRMLAATAPKVVVFMAFLLTCFALRVSCHHDTPTAKPSENELRRHEH
jgi:hypothetical protein